MAHAVPAAQRKIIAVPPAAPPLPHLLAARLPSAPAGIPIPAVSMPLPPPAAAGYLLHQGHLLFPPGRPVVVVTGAGDPATAPTASPLPCPGVTVSAAPPAVMCRALWANVDNMRAHTLALLMANEGLVPSQEEELKRVDVIVQLKKIVLIWIKKVAVKRELPNELIGCASATILPYGSYGLGVHGFESDIDALCAAPCYATLEEDFFEVLYGILLGRPEVSELHSIKSAKVPLMRFKFNGILVDFPFVRLNALTVPDNVDLFDPIVLKIDETSWRSLSGVRANMSILNLVPNLKDFQATLRCLKLWAKRRGLYSHLLGFFGGIHLAVLAAYICRSFPNASVGTLILLFFDVFLHWRWPEPVVLLSNSVHMPRPDGRSFMPIMMPCSPHEWCHSNITRSTFSKIKAEFLRGYSLTRDPRLDMDWRILFEPFPYAKKYRYFLKIFLVAPDFSALHNWLGWVKSRFRSLLLKLEDIQGYCDPNPTEYVDHEVTEPNTVFFWGLSLTSRNLIDADKVKHDFMRSVDKDEYGSHDGHCCRLELSIVEAAQLPKSMQFDTGGPDGQEVIWRLVGYDLQGKPVYARHLPHHHPGRCSGDGEHPIAVG